MMNEETLHRIKTAAEYQRKAIRALFPEEMGGHLDVMEKELKMMLMELAAELLKECSVSDSDNGGHSDKQTSNVKKVDIA